jgi:hypothetical protein
MNDNDFFTGFLMAFLVVGIILMVAGIYDANRQANFDAICIEIGYTAMERRYDAGALSIYCVDYNEEPRIIRLGEE